MSKTTPIKSDSVLYLFIVFIIIVIIVGSICSISNWITQTFSKTSTPTPTYTSTATSTGTATPTNTPSLTPTPTFLPPLVIETVANPALDVIYGTTELSCKENGEVEYSIIDVTITGGIKPYKFKIQNMANQVLGPFPVQNEREPIRLKLYGGESAWVEIWSGNQGEPSWTGFITSPVKDPTCNATPTPFPVPSNTPRPTKTPVPSFTSTIHPDVSNTPIPGASNTPVSGASNTPVPGTSNTPNIVPSNTKVIVPSNTPIIVPSNTPIIVPSNTPIIVPSNTLRPTNTLVPTPTPFNPNPKECEDGIDNDGDSLIDFPYDKQCDRPGDPHENK